MRTTPSITEREYYARTALDHLAQAALFAKWAGAPRLHARLRAALKSAHGAVNHATHRVRRADAGNPMRSRTP